MKSVRSWRFPDDVMTLIIQGDLFVIAGDLVKSRESFAAALKLDPYNANAKQGFDAVTKMQASAQ